ncbi:MAG: RNA-metabolising metallo-beta-lactamase [Alphaproteobacteria bacterium ADurb.Bin438]|nr:MAG: RNA-metabolising metallo-beta-lactamase [Alphaproteobacteria bacterium ADurb.Bin438]
MFESFVKNPPKDIDILLMEGSSLGRLNNQENFEKEEDLEHKIADVLNNTKGMTFIQMSSQNFDRIVSVYRACKKSGKILVMSGYTGLMLKVTENPNLPNFTWKDVKKIEVEAIKKHHITVEEINKNRSQYVYILGKGYLPLFDKAGLINQNASYIYSMWSGYKEKYADVIDKMKEAKAFMVDIHTSGHADIPTLKRLVDALKPKKVVPIHTFYPEEFKNLFENTEIHNDNEQFNI